MNAYHGSDTLKMQFIQTAHQHEVADAYVKGLYWQEAEKRGCNIGCWTKAENGRHDALAVEMGVPVQLLHLSDGIFEALPDPHFKSWSRRFAQAIVAGSDLEFCWAAMLHWMLCDQEWGLVVLAEASATRLILKDLGHYFSTIAQGGKIAEPDRGLCEQMGRLRQSLSVWKNWDRQAMRDMRAIRASLELWRTRPDDFKSLSRAAWAVRAAWSAWEAYSIAQSEALIEILTKAPVLMGA